MLIVNADDFGASEGINRGIAEAHSRGIVTSTSLMVTGGAPWDAVSVAGDHPSLSIGLHWDLDSGGRPKADLADPAAIRAELIRQLEAFLDLMGRPPSHLDSHHHIHREPEIGEIARELAATHRLPLREGGRVSFVGGFYGQWEYGVTDLYHVSPQFLVWILRNEVGDGWTELGCHPGSIVGDFTSIYLAEREVELATLTDPRIREEVDRLGIRLASYAELEPSPR